MQMEREIDLQYYSQDTKKAYLSHARNFIIFCKNNPVELYGEKAVQERIKDYLHHLIKKGYKASSLNTAKYALIYYFEQVRHEQIRVRLSKIKRPIQYPKCLAELDIKLLIEATKNLKYRTLIELTYGSGLRLSEAISVQWEDIDFQDSILNVVHGKGAKDRITIISEQTLQHLKDWKIEQEKLNQKSKWVFNSSQRNFHICQKSFQNKLKDSAKKAGLEVNVFVHRLRHSFGKHLFDNGTDSRYIQKLLGHGSLKTTERYIYVSNRDIKNIKSPLDKIADRGLYKE